jgi:hypothetical protein
MLHGPTKEMETSGPTSSTSLTLMRKLSRHCRCAIGKASGALEFLFHMSEFHAPNPFLDGFDMSSDSVTWLPRTPAAMSSSPSLTHRHTDRLVAKLPVEYRLSFLKRPNAKVSGLRTYWMPTGAVMT